MDINRIRQCNPSYILDIGANIGRFSQQCMRLFPSAYVLMIEGNANCEPALKATGLDYRIALLSDVPKEVTLYLTGETTQDTGASYKKENTRHYKDPVVREVYTQTLDDIVFETGLSFDFIKLDTQGSELEIMQGGIQTLSAARWVLTECNTIKDRPYNEDAPHISEIVEFMVGLGFQDTPEVLHRATWGDAEDTTRYSIDECFQMDVLFQRKSQ